MRAWTKSACVVLAWSILSVILVAVGLKGSVHPAQANTRTASSTEVTLTSTPSIAAAPAIATTNTTRYVVHNGDTLSGIAARFAVRGGWPALYAANRQAIGPDPNLIHSGTVLVLPGRKVPVRYIVAAGDTLTGIAAEFAVRGGWPALYAANRQAIGPDPNLIHSGTVLTVPRQAVPVPPAPGRAFRRQHPPAPPSAPSAGPPRHRLPTRTGAPATTGMPRWLTTLLLAVGLLILVAFLAALAVLNRRRRQAAAQALQSRSAVGSSQRQGFRWPGAVDAAKARIVLADHDRLVVTRSECDDTICVLRPPGEDPEAILRVARLVLPEEPYRDLAAQLGISPRGEVE